MLIEYIEGPLARAKYGIIDDEEPYYGEIPELKGVWATGKTLEQCRKRLSEVIEGWIIVTIEKGITHPSHKKISYQGTQGTKRQSLNKN